MHHLPSRYIPFDGRLTASAYFLTTLPAGGATIVLPIMRCITLYFNPRSLHGERPPMTFLNMNFLLISIHAPRGGRHIGLPVTTLRAMAFQSTLPVGGATFHLPHSLFLLSISIHAPRRGSDSTAKAYSNDRIKRSTLREPHFLFSKNACFSPIFSMCATTSRTKNQRIRVSFGSYPGLAPTCFTLAWYRFPRL